MAGDLAKPQREADIIELALNTLGVVGNISKGAYVRFAGIAHSP
jgi:hypothetical protein